MTQVNFSTLCHFTPKQLLATEVADKYRYTLFGGAAGPGKSYWLRWYAIRQLIIWGKKHNLRGITGALFSEDYPTLKDRQISKIEVEFPRWLGSIKDSKIHGLGFHVSKQFGGHVLALRNLDDPSKYLSSEFALIAVEELTKNEEMVFDRLRSRLRWTGIEDTRFIAATNPGEIGHCVPYGEVLTPKGWVEIQNTKVGDLIATSDEKENFIFLPVSQVWQESYNGGLLDFSSATTRIRCTPDHKIVRRTETKNSRGRIFHKPSLIAIKDVSGVTRLVRSSKNWQGKAIKRFEVPHVKTRNLRLSQPAVISGDDFCSFMGWFLSEGSTNDRDKEFSISQIKEDNRQEIKELLNQCGFLYREHSAGFTVCSPSWWAYLRQFGKCRDKFVPPEIKNAVQEQLSLFLSSALKGDGHGIHYYSTSRRLADDMQEIGLKLGYSPRISHRQRKNRNGLSYDISFRNGRDACVEKSAIKVVLFSGKVYCLGIDNIHRFFLRQNGTIWLSGNSWVKKRWVDQDFPHEEKEKDQFKYVPALPTENPYLAESYLVTLASLPEKLRKAYLEGNWDIFEGQYFTEWDRAKHIVVPFAIPNTWKRYRAYDHGRANAACCLWFAVDYDGTVWVYRELYAIGLNVDEIAQKIADLSTGEYYEYSVADPAIFANLGYVDKFGGQTIAETFAHYAILWLPASNRRIDGWNLLHQYLTHNQLIFFNTTANAVRTIPTLIHDEHKPEDVDTRGEDHCFIGSTLVDTAFGKKQIKDLVGKSVYVNTPVGFVKCRNVRKTRREKVWRLETKDGRVIYATADHRLLTQRGWVQVQDIDTRYDVLIQSDICIKSYLRLFKSIMALGITYVVNTFRRMGEVYTSKCGSFTMEKLRRGIIYTTKTIIGRTTISRISKNKLLTNISRFTPERLKQNYARESQSRKQLLKRLNGIGLRRAANGIANILPRWPKSGFGLKRLVSFAVAYTQLQNNSHTNPSSAISIAKCVPFGVEEVYNLTVPDIEHFTIEDGIVVHNCADVVRYFLMSLHERKTERPLNEIEKKLLELKQRDYITPSNLNKVYYG